MEKSMSTGALLYSAGATILLLYFVGSWQVERGESRVNLADLYAVCSGLRVLSPQVMIPLPIPTTPEAALALEKDRVMVHRRTIARICNEDHAEEFARIERRSGRR